MRNFIKKFFFFFPLSCIPIIRIPFRRQGYKLPSLVEKWKVDALPCSYDPRTEKKFHTYVYIFPAWESSSIAFLDASPSSPDNELPPLPSRISYSCESRRLFRDDGRKVAKELWYKSPSDCKTQVRLWTMHVSLPDRLMPIPNRFFLLFSFPFSKLKLR